MGVSFDVRTDVRVFALFVALNGAGYDLESGPEGMHPCRIAVREALTGWSSPLKERVRSLLVRSHPWVFLFWALNRELLGLPGGGLSLADLEAKFRSYEVEEAVPPFAALETELEEVAPAVLRELPWERLWGHHRVVHEIQAERYQLTGPRAVAEVVGYLRPRTEPTHAVVYVPNLLDSYFTGYAVETEKEIFLIGGPSSEVNVALIQHEYAHVVVNPVVYGQQALLKKTRHLMSRLVDPANPHLAPYRHWPTFVAENLVEAVTYLVDRPTSEVLARRLAHSVNIRGLTLVPAFVEALMPHGDGDAPCEEFLPKVLQEVLSKLT